MNIIFIKQKFQETQKLHVGKGKCLVRATEREMSVQSMEMRSNRFFQQSSKSSYPYQFSHSLFRHLLILVCTLSFHLVLMFSVNHHAKVIATQVTCQEPSTIFEEELPLIHSFKKRIKKQKRKEGRKNQSSRQTEKKGKLIT